jgi:hypothetical protein
MNLTECCKRIKAHIERGDRDHAKGDQHYVSAGQLLKQLKDTRTGAQWEKIIREKCGIGRSRGNELIAIADGRKTAGDVRLATNQRKLKHRASPFRNGKNKAETDQSFIGPPDDMPSEAEAEESHQAGMLDIVPHYIGLMSEPTRQKLFAKLKKKYPVADQPVTDLVPPDIVGNGENEPGDTEEEMWRRGLLYRAASAAGGALYEDWSAYKVDEEVVTATSKAAMAWALTADYLRSLKAGANPANAPDPLTEDSKSNGAGAKPDLVAAARAAKAERDVKRVERARARHG